MLFFTKICCTTLRVPSQSYGYDFGRDKSSFSFLVVMAPSAVCMLGEPLNLEPDLENIYALQQFCLNVKITFSETLCMGLFYETIDL